MEYTPLPNCLRVFIPSSLSDGAQQVIELVKKYAPTVYSEGTFYNMKGELSYMWVMAGDNCISIGSLHLAEELELMERYYRCQTGRATEKEKADGFHRAHECQSAICHACNLARDMSYAAPFIGCDIFVTQDSVIINSGWWSRKVNVSGGSVQLECDKIDRTHDSEIVDHVRSVGCKVIEMNYNSLIVYPFVMSVDTYRYWFKGKDVEIINYLKYKQWQESIIAITRAFLPMPIADEVIDQI